MTTPTIDPQALPAHAPAAPEPGPEHRQLGVFAGRWRIEGHNLDGAPDRPGSAVSGEGHYEWLPGDFFLTARETARFAGHEHVTLMVFGYEAESRSYRAHFYDNGGYSRVYAGQVDGRVWTFTGRLERVRIEVSEDARQLRHFWERTEDGRQWMALCELTSTKLAA